MKKTLSGGALMAVCALIVYVLGSLLHHSAPAAGVTSLEHGAVNPAPIGATAVTQLVEKALAQRVVNTSPIHVPAAVQRLGEMKVVNGLVEKFDNQPTRMKVVEGVAAAAAVVAGIEVVKHEHTSAANAPAAKEDAVGEAAGGESPAKTSPPSRLLVGINIQGGVVANVDHATGYIGGVQWLKWGSTNDPRNLSFAFLTPVFYGSPNVKEFGWLPVSWNVAHRIPHQPFTNIWFSPYVGGFNPRHPSRVGVALTATF